MKRRTRIILGVAGLILGWFLSGWGYTTKLGHPISTMAFLVGLVLFFVGLRFIVRK
jgi:hypothetical protein